MKFIKSFFKYYLPTLIFFGALGILLNISCSNYLEEENTLENSINKSVNFSEINTNKKVTKLEYIDKYILYTRVLSHIFNQTNENDPLGPINPTEILVYKSKTVFPQGIAQIKDNAKISKSLYENFKVTNQKTEILEEGYSVLGPVIPLSGESDLKRFYNLAKKKYSDAKAVVGLSNIGINEDFSQALVFVEYYHPQKGLIKFYYKMKVVRHTSGMYEGEINQISNFEIIPLN